MGLPHSWSLTMPDCEFVLRLACFKTCFAMTSVTGKRADVVHLVTAMLRRTSKDADSDYIICHHTSCVRSQGGLGNVVVLVELRKEYAVSCGGETLRVPHFSR